MRSNSLSLHEDTLLVASEVKERGTGPAGVFLYDVEDPRRPRQVGFFDTSGPGSRGTHFVSTFDGEYANLSTGMPDFEPITPRDDNFYMMIDIRNRAKPTEVSRWWLPGQRKSDPIHDAPTACTWATSMAG